MVKVSLQQTYPEGFAPQNLVLTHCPKTGRPRKAVVYVDALIRLGVEYDCEDIAEQVDEKAMGGCSVALPSDAQPARVAAVEEIRQKLESLLA